MTNQNQFDNGLYDRRTLEKLIQIGNALSATTGLKDLLKLITTESRNLTNSDAGSIYIKKGDQLIFAVSQCDSAQPDPTATITRPIFSRRTLPISTESIAGYVALSKEVERIDDAYNLPPGKPYRHSKIFDEYGNYETHSLLTVPMIDTENQLVGILQLVNHLDKKGKPDAFPESAIPLVRALASQAAVAIRNAQLKQELRAIHNDTIVRLLTAVEFRDNTTGNHVRRVSSYSSLIAESLGFPEIELEKIRSASLLHDIGKVGMPDSILLKPGPLTSDERSYMQTHTEIGAKIVRGSESPLMIMCEEIALAHHEKWDGSGYPKGLKGKEIPLTGRIVALADVFDAISTKRCYKNAVPFEDVLPVIQKDAGLHFDPTCVKAFFSKIGQIRHAYEKLEDSP